MLKFINTKDAQYNGLLYRGRKVIADEKLLERLAKVPEAIVYSSWRSLAEQKVLFQAGKSKTLNSNHRRGMAVDVINWKEVEKKMNKLGLVNDISWDKNHFAYDGELNAALKYPLVDSLPKKLEEFTGKSATAQIPVKNSIVSLPTDKQVQSATPVPSVLPEAPSVPITPIHEVLAESVGVSNEEMTDIVYGTGTTVVYPTSQETPVTSIIKQTTDGFWIKLIKALINLITKK